MSDETTARLDRLERAVFPTADDVAEAHRKNAQWYWDAYHLDRTAWWWRYLVQPNYNWAMRKYREELARADRLASKPIGEAQNG